MAGAYLTGIEGKAGDGNNGGEDPVENVLTSDGGAVHIVRHKCFAYLPREIVQGKRLL